MKGSGQDVGGDGRFFSLFRDLLQAKSAFENAYHPTRKEWFLVHRHHRYFGLTTLYAVSSRWPQQRAPVHVNLPGLDPPEGKSPVSTRGRAAGTSVNNSRCQTRTIAEMMMVSVSERFSSNLHLRNNRSKPLVDRLRTCERIEPL